MQQSKHLNFSPQAPRFFHIYFFQVFAPKHVTALPALRRAGLHTPPEPSSAHKYSNLEVWMNIKVFWKLPQQRFEKWICSSVEKDEPAHSLQGFQLEVVRHGQNTYRLHAGKFSQSFNVLLSLGLPDEGPQAGHQLVSCPPYAIETQHPAPLKLFEAEAGSSFPTKTRSQFWGRQGKMEDGDSSSKGEVRELKPLNKKTSKSWTVSCWSQALLPPHRT